MDMTYVYSGQTEDDFIADILRIDASVFAPGDQGTDASLRARYDANRESYIIAKDGTERVGYLAFFPISWELSGRMVSESAPFDDNIRPEDILPSYDVGGRFDVFFISSAVLPEYQGRGIGAELMERGLAFMRGKIRGGSRILDGYSYAYTGAGARLLEKADFLEVKSLRHPGSGAAIKLTRYRFGEG